MREERLVIQYSLAVLSYVYVCRSGRKHGRDMGQSKNSASFVFNAQHLEKMQKYEKQKIRSISDK